jgi:glycosyltransferase involved in cell wall biosynthesis
MHAAEGSPSTDVAAGAETRPARAQRIAVLLNSLDTGGAQMRVISLINRFASLDREVELFAPIDGGALLPSISSKVRIVALEDGLAAAKPWLARHIGQRSLVQTIVRHLEDWTPDVFISGASATHALAARVRREVPQIPLLLRASSHPLRPFDWSSPFERLREMGRRRLRKHQYAQADAIIAVAEDVAVAVRRLVPRASVTVIHNPVITADFLAGANHPISLPWGDDDDAPLILGVGRLALAKDFPTLLRAFAVVRAQRPVHLAIIGGGTAQESKAIAALAEHLGVAPDVALLGHSDRVAAWLRRASLFVSSSIWEGSPAAIVEALAMGCPVVATDCPGGSRELLDQGRLGELVPPRDVQAMAAAMIAQLETPVDPQPLMAAVTSYAEEGRAEDYLAAIDACVARRRGARR